MSKKIKFDLLFKDEIRVTNVSELRDNFYIDDILNYYQNGTLYRWLINLGEEELAEKIQNITNDVTLEELITQLAETFSLKSSSDEIKAATYAYQYVKNTVGSDDNQSSNVDIKAIHSYIDGYNKLLEEMKTTKNLKILVSQAQQLMEFYQDIFDLTATNALNLLKENDLAIVACLTERDIREKWENLKETNKKIRALIVKLKERIYGEHGNREVTTYEQISPYKDQNVLVIKGDEIGYKRLNKNILQASISGRFMSDEYYYSIFDESPVDGYLHVIRLAMSNEWTMVEPNNKKILLLSPSESQKSRTKIFVRGKNLPENGVLVSEFNSEFPMLDGLEVKISEDTGDLDYCDLYYLEV